MVFGAIRAGRGLKADWGAGALQSLGVNKTVLAIAAAGVLAVMAVALLAFIRVGG